jgi:hypothetical protein
MGIQEGLNIKIHVEIISWNLPLTTVGDGDPGGTEHQDPRGPHDRLAGQALPSAGTPRVQMGQRHTQVLYL